MAVRAEPRVVVAGAGPVGLAAAAAIRKASPRVQVTVCDPATQDIRMPTESGLRVIAMTPASMSLFDSIGILSTLPEFALAPYERMRVWDAGHWAADGIEFAAYRVGRKSLGAMTDVAALQASLFEHLASDSGVSLLADGVAEIESRDDGVRVTTLSGDTLEAELLIGADGRQSRVRQSLGLGVRRWSHHQRAVVATLMPELAHERTALQRFLPDGPLALLPLRDARVSLVWSTLPEHARALQTMSAEAFTEAVSEASDQILGRLSPTSPVISFPLESAYVTDPIAPRTALIGDAAHAIHPLAGQGANLGFADAVALAGIVKEVVESRGDPGDAPWLRRYRRTRRADNLTTLFGMDFINRLFGRDQGAFADLRRRGMQWFQSSSLAEQLAIGHATTMRGVDALGEMS